MKVLSIFGTRPEAIKMAPLVRALDQAPEVESIVCVSGQHEVMLEQVLSLFDIRPDFNLGVMRPNQSLNGVSSLVLTALDPIFDDVRPDRVLVHGDTTTSMSAALAAFHRHIPVGHVEAGLRTYDVGQPWPEEMNRRVVDVIGDLLFAPTEDARDNLLAERLEGRVIVTGNTVIDALYATVARIDGNAALRAQLATTFKDVRFDRKILLVTSHRRENLGGGLERICEALAILSHRSDIDIVFPVHLNPNVREVVYGRLEGIDNVHLIEPLDYARFVYIMNKARAILTDSGGIQEEAPALGKPVLATRDVTERPEAVAAGGVALVGTDTRRIVRRVSDLFDSETEWRSFAAKPNPYGDGNASDRIVAALVGREFEEFKVAPRGALSERPNSHRQRRRRAG